MTLANILPDMVGIRYTELVEPMQRAMKLLNELPTVRYTVRSTGAADDQNRINDAVQDVIAKYSGGRIYITDRNYNLNDSIILGIQTGGGDGFGDFSGVSIHGGNGEIGSYLNFNNQKAFTVNASTDVFTSNAHLYANGTPVMFLSSGALPGG